MIALEDFCNTFNVTSNNITTQINKGILPAHIVSKGFIDDKFFHKRKDFHQKLWIKAHENFYFLNKHLDSSTIALLLSKAEGTRSNWLRFINNDLFELRSESITHFKVSGQLWKFYKYTTWVIQYMFKLVGITRAKRNLSILIER